MSEQAPHPRYRGALDDAWRAAAALLAGGVVPLPDLVRRTRRYRRAWRGEQTRHRAARSGQRRSTEPSSFA